LSQFEAEDLPREERVDVLRASLFRRLLKGVHYPLKPNLSNDKKAYLQKEMMNPQEDRERRNLREDIVWAEDKGEAVDDRDGRHGIHGAPQQRPRPLLRLR